MPDLPPTELSVPSISELSLISDSDQLLWYIWRNALRALPCLSQVYSEYFPKKAECRLIKKDLYEVVRPIFFADLKIKEERFIYGKPEAKFHQEAYKNSDFHGFELSSGYLKDFFKKSEPETISFNTGGNYKDATHALGRRYAHTAFLSALEALYCLANSLVCDEEHLVALAFKVAEEANRAEKNSRVADIVSEDIFPDKKWVSDSEYFNLENYTMRYFDNIRDQRSLELNVASTRSDYEIISWGSIRPWNEKLSLWSGSYEEINSGTRRNVRKWKSALHDFFVSAEIDFIFFDIENFWQGEAAEKHTKNYLKSYSETIVSDASSLKETIWGMRATEKVHAVRCLLLGPGGAGKSSLADRLQGKPVSSSKKVTLGVDYLEHRPLNLKATFPEFETENLELYLWDFGGQTIFHGLHSAFLHENCVYVLVVDSRHEQAPDDWLYQIRNLASAKAKVLLITNWYEQCEIHQNEKRLLREFPDLLFPDSFFYFSCLNEEAVQLHEFVRSLLQTSYDRQKTILKEILDVHRAIQRRYQNDIFLDEDTLDNIIQRTTGKKGITTDTGNKLRQLGFLVHVDNDGEHFCLKPSWAVDHAYQLLYSPRLRNANGVLTLSELKQELKDQAQVSKKYTGHLVSFLQERSLCQRLQNDAYFFPDAAPANEPEAATQILQNQQGLVIRFDLPYLPLGFHARLVNHLFVPGNDVSIAGPEDIWRQGFILCKGETKAVVHYLLRKNVIEMVLVGDLTDFSALLNTLYVNLKAVMTAGEGMNANQIHPSVKMHDEIFSVHSAEGLVRVLEGINDYVQLFDKVRAMAAKYNINVGDNAQVAVDAKDVTQQYKSNNMTVNTDQREQIAILADALLGNAQSLKPNELVAVAEVKQALAEPEQEASKGLLGNIWQATTDIAGFGSNLAQLHQWAEQNKGLIAAAWAAGAALL